MPAKATDFDLVLDKIGQDRYSATAILNGKEVASCEFDCRMGTLATRQDLQRIEQYAVSGEPPPGDFHIEFGKDLHDKAVGGKIEEKFGKARKKGGVRLRVRITDDALELEKLPWELMHDGEKFLAVRPGVLLSRLPAGIERRECEPVEGHLRMLVIISSPTDLGDNEVLRVEREQEIILTATEKLRRDRKLQIDFVEDASMRTIEEYLDETDYHIIHFTGHGSFDEHKDEGFLLLQDEQGKKRAVSIGDFAEMLAERETLRLVLLSACQTAQRSSNPALPGLARVLLERGIPAALAMQHSIKDGSALALASRFYKTLGAGRTIDEAVQRARSELLEEGKGRGLDFATPVVSLNDPGCIEAKELVPAEKELEAAQHVLSGGVAVMRTGFVGRRRELRRMRDGFRTGQKRAFVIHGIGGIGKSVLASRLGDSLKGDFDGWVGIKCNLDTKPEDVLIQVNAFLNMAGINDFNAHIHAPVKTPQKVDALVPILCKRRFLVILDNCEDLLESGQAIKGKGEGKARHVIVDADMADLFQRLLNGVSEGSKFVITTRYDFEPLGEAGRLAGQIEHVQLGEMSFPYAVFIMENLPTLADLPVAPPPTPPGEPVPEVGPTKLEICAKMGGHPVALGLFNTFARETSVGHVLLDLGPLRDEMARMALLDRMWERLTDRARELCRRASIFEQAAPLSGLQWLMGDQENRGPDIGAEVQELLNWGMMGRAARGTDALYAMPEMVKHLARGKLRSDEERRLLLAEAGRFYWMRAQEKEIIWDAVRARDYLHRAGEYDEAYRILATMVETLRRWGHVSLLLRMLGESVQALTGHSKVLAAGDLAILYRAVGDYERARADQEAVRDELERAGDRRGVAVSHQELGEIHYLQGQHREAVRQCEQALGIAAELGDKALISDALHLRGVIHQGQGEYREAIKLYTQSLEIAADLGDKARIAGMIQQWGRLHHQWGEYGQAVKLYERCLQIARALGDKPGIASTLHQLGMIHQDQGDCDEAVRLYEGSLEIARALGDKATTASTLLMLGIIHQDQGDYGEAVKLYEQGLELAQQLGDKFRMASAQHEIGMVRQKQGRHDEATELYEQALATFREMGDKAGIGTTLHAVGSLREERGDFRSALDHFVNALSALAALRSPDADTARRSLRHLRERMGEEVFKKAWKEITGEEFEEKVLDGG